MSTAGRMTPVGEHAESTPETSERGNRRDAADRQANAKPMVPEIGGPKGPEPTRYGDWERNGRCSDF